MQPIPLRENLTGSPFTVARMVTSADSFAPLSDELAYLRSARRCLEQAAERISDRVDVLQTGGGFLWRYRDLGGLRTGERTRSEDFQRAKVLAGEALERFLDTSLLHTLRAKARFLTVGVDLRHAREGLDAHQLVARLPRSARDRPSRGELDTHAELVASIDLDSGRVISWTGKTHPVDYQTRTLVYCVDLPSHFQQFGDRRVLVLGCHDMNIFSNRSRASTSPGTYKSRVIAEMQRLSDEFLPEVVLSHPHGTDTPQIWSTALSGMQESIPTARAISIGIHYENTVRGGLRAPLQAVLDRTKRGNVIDLLVKGT